MAYKMRYRVRLLLVTPQNAEAPAEGNDPELISVGDTETLFNEDGSFASEPTGPILQSLSAAVAAIMGINNRFQRGLKTNTRFEVYGKPVGTPEDGAEDIPEAYKNEMLYISGDTPNAGLVYYILRANKKPAVASQDAVYLPPDRVPEPYVGYVGPPLTP